MTDEPKPVTGQSVARLLWGLVFVVASLCAGFLVGGLIGRELIPAGSGLEAGAIVLGYALSGALVGSVTAAVVAWRFELRQVRVGALITVAVAIVSAAFLAM
jgi:hypothetical protein